MARGRAAKRQKGVDGAPVPSIGSGAVAATTIENSSMPRKRPLPKAEYVDVWKDVFFSGTEWEQIKEVEDFEWDFEHLDDELTDGELSNRMVHLFGCTEPQLVHMGPEDTKGSIVPVPAIVVIDCTRPPPSTVGIKSVQRTEEEIIPMRQLKMGWHPYVPANLTGSRRFKPCVHVLKCEQRRARLRNMTEAAVHKYDYVLPYLVRPELQDDITIDTEVQAIVEIEGRKAPLMLNYDFEMDDLDEFIKEQIEEHDLDVKKHDEVLRTAIKDSVRSTKRRFAAEKEERQKRIDDIPEDVREAIRNMRLFKFYPQNETPNLSSVKSKYVNRYYGQADRIM